MTTLENPFPAAVPGVDDSGNRGGRARFLQPLARRTGQLVVMLFAISTVLFVLLRMSGDPAAVIAGEFADAEFLERVREQYGFDKGVVSQYVNFMSHAARLDFGDSIRSSTDAFDLVLERLPATAQLAALAVLFNMVVAVPLGAWLGSRPDRAAQGVVGGAVFIAQGVPGYVTGLVLIQLFSVRFHVLPSVGNTETWAWVLPSVTLAVFMVPRLTRVVSANVSEAMEEDYVRTARANGAAEATVVIRHALPNALLAATALIGGQFAFLLSGALITEVIFAWPGLGRLMIDSVRELDFPVVQAAVFVVGLLVFAANLVTDVLFQVLDPRLRRQRS